MQQMNTANTNHNNKKDKDKSLLVTTIPMPPNYNLTEESVQLLNQ